MRNRFIAAALAGAVGILPAAGEAKHGNDPDQCRGRIGGMYVKHAAPPYVQIPVVSSGIVVAIRDPKTGPLYLDVRDLGSDHHIFSLWLYQESNKIAGLQRGGRSLVPDTPATSGVEPCQETAAANKRRKKKIKPDQLIY